MASVNIETLETVNITDKDVMVLKILQGLAEEDRYVYTIHKAVKEHFKSATSITQRGVRLILEKYARFGVLSISTKPTPSEKGPATYLVTTKHPELLSLVILKWQIRQLQLIYEAKKAIYESRRLKEVALGRP